MIRTALIRVLMSSGIVLAGVSALVLADPNGMGGGQPDCGWGYPPEGGKDCSTNGFCVSPFSYHSGPTLDANYQPARKCLES
jgi:hypothetical protein